MRLYSWVNMYLEGIHAGIQTAHVQAEIESKYRRLANDDVVSLVTATPNTPERKLKMYHDWADYHKVIQVYNGGYSSSLRHRYERLSIFAEHFKLPFAKFHEGQDALDGALTAVGIIVPEQYYNRALIKKSDPRSACNRLGEVLSFPKTDEEEFHEFLHSCKHAR